MNNENELPFDLQGLIDGPNRAIRTHLNNLMADLGCKNSEEFHKKLSEISRDPIAFVMNKKAVSEGIQASKLLESLSILRLESIIDPDIVRKIDTEHGVSLDDPVMLQAQIDSLKVARVKNTKYMFNLSKNKIIYVKTGCERSLTKRQHLVLLALNPKAYQKRSFLLSQSSYGDEGFRTFIKSFNAWVRKKCEIPIHAIKGDKKSGGYKFAECIGVMKVGRHET